MKYSPEKSHNGLIDDGITDFNDVARFIDFATCEFGNVLTPEMAVQQFNDLMDRHDRELIAHVERVHHGRIGRV